ncbi:MAG: hypothetical protein RSE91_01620 [Bacilli bacterium]
MKINVLGTLKTNSVLYKYNCIGEFNEARSIITFVDNDITMSINLTDKKIIRRNNEFIIEIDLNENVINTDLLKEKVTSSLKINVLKINISKDSFETQYLIDNDEITLSLIFKEV